MRGIVQEARLTRIHTEVLLDIGIPLTGSSRSGSIWLKPDMYRIPRALSSTLAKASDFKNHANRAWWTVGTKCHDVFSDSQCVGAGRGVSTIRNSVSGLHHLPPELLALTYTFFTCRNRCPEKRPTVFRASPSPPFHLPQSYSPNTYDWIISFPRKPLMAPHFLQ